MAIRNIFKQGESILRKQARPVEVFDEKLWQLLDDMWETLFAADGAGLAGNQVGVLKQVCLLYIDEQKLELINPVIVSQSDETCVEYEGCLSIVDDKGNLLYDKVERPKEVVVKYFDRNGKPQKKKLKGFMARCACHEIDHLHGVLYTDRVDF